MQDHYLCGPCEGVSLHTNGSSLEISEPSGSTYFQYNSDQEASEALWKKRDELYEKYGRLHSPQLIRPSRPDITPTGAGA
jgi:hypothetical protein